MLSLVEQAFVGRAEIRAPLKTPAWEARVLLAVLPLSLTLLIKKNNISALRTRECIGSRVDKHPANRFSFCLVG